MNTFGCQKWLVINENDHTIFLYIFLPASDVV